MTRLARIAAAAVLVAAGTISCRGEGTPPEDRFRVAGATQETYKDPGVDALPGMDNNAVLSVAEIRGRNSWVLWTAGNERFWDWLARHGYGTVDFLRLIDSRKRDTRFDKLGLINDPNLVPATHEDEFGLWIDSIATPEPAEIRPDVYGKPTGIMGLRYYPNPEFVGAARDRWMSNKGKFYTDTAFFSDSGLVRPYIVGMACGFCHVGPHPLNPPADRNHPKFENMSATIGAQYFKSAPIFAPAQDATSFVYQLLQGYREGTLDTSLIASDQIFNPSNMNAIFELAARIDTAGTAITTRDSMGVRNAQVPGIAALTRVTHSPRVPHILKDGADNVGATGALSRVFVNIGEYWQQWITDHEPIIGTKSQRAFSVPNAVAHSDYWNATAARLDDITAYFLKVTGAMRLADAPGGQAILARDESLVPRGRDVFANECAECHSSKRPPVNVTAPADRRAWFRTAAATAEFLQGNYLSTDQRQPVSDDTLRTNACRAAGTNAVSGHVWDNFSSETYKASKAVSSYNVQVPYAPADLSPETATLSFPRGGPGYYRPATLVSMWATAPYFHNNALGKFTGDPSVKGRLDAFDDAVNKLLSPRLRAGNGSVSRTTARSSLTVPKTSLPDFIAENVGTESNGLVRIGPIPKGTPVALLGSMKLKLTLDPAYDFNAAKAVVDIVKALRSVKGGASMTDAALADAMRPLVPTLLKLNNCPDFVEDGGHYYGTELTEADKRALIAYLKRL